MIVIVLIECYYILLTLVVAYVDEHIDVVVVASYAVDIHNHVVALVVVDNPHVVVDTYVVVVAYHVDAADVVVLVDSNYIYIYINLLLVILINNNYK